MMDSNNQKRILIIDNDLKVGEFFIHLINGFLSEFFVIGYFNSFENAKESIEALKPDIILMDINLPGLNGIDATKIIKRNFPQIEILIISIHEDNDQLYQAVVNGASGNISKISNQFEILQRLEEITNGEAAMSSKIARAIKEDIELNSLTYAFAEIELRILNKLSVGKTYTQMAEELETSKTNIKIYIKSIYLSLSIHKSAKESIK